uniref:VanZ-like domain-containing protein n=1 Tax=Bionectria ochroleuca TaxID=29856 RepID=A0A8H7NIK4_BIOOC
MRIRFSFAGVFLLLLLAAAYAGLTSLQLGHIVNDKVLHVATFFVLTVVFYWIVDTNRRRTLHMTLIVCTLILGIGSEFLQSFLPNGREFDMYDIVANIVGSLAGLGLCTWYHKRMLDRRRQRKTYNAVPGEDEADLELGEGHETGLLTKLRELGPWRKRLIIGTKTRRTIGMRKMLLMAMHQRRPTTQKFRALAMRKSVLIDDQSEMARVLSYGMGKR